MPANKYDPRPLEDGCQCPRLPRLFPRLPAPVVKADEIIGSMLLTWHNLHYYQVLMQGLRDAIAAGRLAAFVATSTRHGRRGISNPSERETALCKNAWLPWR